MSDHEEGGPDQGPLGRMSDARVDFMMASRRHHHARVMERVEAAIIEAAIVEGFDLEETDEGIAVRITSALERGADIKRMVKADLAEAHARSVDRRLLDADGRDL